MLLCGWHGVRIQEIASHLIPYLLVEETILASSENPGLVHNQLIRPCESRLSLHYIDHQSFWLDMRLIVISILVIVSRPAALRWVVRELRNRQAPVELIEVASRTEDLVSSPAPGSDRVTIARE
jgi:hypothetical protein